MIPENLINRRLMLFGAGRVGQDFVTNFPQLNVVAIVDNDTRKHGEMIHGAPVIAPESINGFEYDLVVITTGWWKSISRQLQNLSVPQEKIILPPKSMLAIHHGRQPFSDESTKACAERAMQSLADFAELRNLRFCLDFGTLLGACRDRDFIPWDDDIDLAATSDDFDSILDALQELRNNLADVPGVTIEISLFSTGAKPSAIAITFTNSDAEDRIIPFEIGIMRRTHESGMWITKGYGTEFIAPEIHFNTYDRIIFLGRSFNTPHRTEDYLKFVYGDWRKPVMNTTLADYPTQEPDYKQPSKISIQ